MSSRVRSKRSDQSWYPLVTSMSCAVTRSRPPACRTLPSRTDRTPSFSPIARTSSALSLKANEDVRGKDEIACGLKSLPGILLEAVARDIGERVRETACRGQGRRDVTEHGGKDLRGRGTGERPPPGQHLPEHRPERKEVAAVIDGESAHLLGRHVGHRPHHRPRLCMT